MTPLLLLAMSHAMQAKATDVLMQGWTVRTTPEVLIAPEWLAASEELRNQLYRINRVVPDEPLKKLHQIVIWVTREDPKTPCAAYHPDVAWLKDNHLNPEMAKCVQIANIKNFCSWTYEQPWMILHELAHGYHDQFLPKGFDNPTVKAAYDAAMASGKYKEVLHWNGAKAKHYATNNQMEYFSESTEAYFGQNDFYPFVNAELKTYDPGTYTLMQTIWGTPQKRP